jgi:glutamate dehydrogenase
MAGDAPLAAKQNLPSHMRAPPTNKLLEQVVRSPDRMPSPQPTNLSVPGQSHKVLHETGSGYVAPKFEGKAEQMEK